MNIQSKANQIFPATIDLLLRTFRLSVSYDNSQKKVTTRSSRQEITMRGSKTKADQADVGIFRHIPAYSDILRNKRAYSGIIQTYLGIPWRYNTLHGRIQNPV